MEFVNIFFFSEEGLFVVLDNSFPCRQFYFSDNISKKKKPTVLSPCISEYVLSTRIEKSVFCRYMDLSQCLLFCSSMSESVSCKCHAVVMNYFFMVYFEVKRYSDSDKGWGFTVLDILDSSASSREKVMEIIPILCITVNRTVILIIWGFPI